MTDGQQLLALAALAWVAWVTARAWFYPLVACPRCRGRGLHARTGTAGLAPIARRCPRCKGRPW
ncbi:MAG: hypothetical protein ACRDRZ_11010, partial [Pseudonocardiaceae bacterium]